MGLRRRKPLRNIEIHNRIDRPRRRGSSCLGSWRPAKAALTHEPSRDGECCRDGDASTTVDPVTASGSNDRRRIRLFDAFRTKLWPVPAIGVLLALIAGVGLPKLEDALREGLPATLANYLFGGGPAEARELLSAIASSLITGHLADVLADRGHAAARQPSQYFAPTAATAARDPFRAVHACSVPVDLRLRVDLAPKRPRCIGDHRSLRAEVLRDAGLPAGAGKCRRPGLLSRTPGSRDPRRDDHANSERRRRGFPKAIFAERDSTEPNPAAPAPPPWATTICAASSGFLVTIDEAGLLSAAVDADAVVSVNRPPAIGWFRARRSRPVGVRTTPIDWTPKRSTCLRRRAPTHYTPATNTPVQDAGYGLRQLTDVAVKALSPGINDPTTAVHALGHSASLLCLFATRRLGDKVLTDDDGRTRRHQPPRHG